MVSTQSDVGLGHVGLATRDTVAAPQLVAVSCSCCVKTTLISLLYSDSDRNFGDFEAIVFTCHDNVHYSRAGLHMLVTET